MKITHIECCIQGPKIVSNKIYLTYSAIATCNNARCFNPRLTVSLLYARRSHDRNRPRLAKPMRKIEATLKCGNISKQVSFPASAQQMTLIHFG